MPLIRRASTQAPAELLAEARRDLDQQDYTGAAELAALAAARAPAQAEAWQLLGLARTRAGQTALALMPFARAVQCSPRSAVAHFNLAAVLQALDHPSEAEREYLAAAALAERLAPLALLDAARAADAASRRDRALAHAEAARDAAQKLDQAPVAERASELLETLKRQSDGPAAHLHTLALRAQQALRQRRLDEAAARYRSALGFAAQIDADKADQAELHYGLGHALYLAGDAIGAARQFDAAVAISPNEADFSFMLGLAHFDAGADSDAAAALHRALKLGLRKDDAARASHILTTLKRVHHSDTARFFAEVRVGAGFDTDVPQSAVVLTASKTQIATDAPFLSADLDLFWRPLGTPRNGFTVDYRLGQIGYLSHDLDPYSLQEHDLTLSGAWTPHARVTLQAGVDGYVLFTGVESFAPFQLGLAVGPRLVIHENHGLETRLRFEHVLKQSLTLSYDYLTGQHEDLGAAEVWREERTTASFAYQFVREAIGVERVALGNLALPLAKPGSYDPAAIYNIPYSYHGHEWSLSVARELPLDLRLAATVRYEHRRYLADAFLINPGGTLRSNYRQRIDDRFSGDLSLRLAAGKYVELELAYTVIVNISTIDNTRASTPYDYDDKNFVKHVAQLELAVIY